MSHSSVLYVDFDNLIIGLNETDPLAAIEFASDPAGWLTKLLSRAADDGVRRWLVRRCYLNPNGFIADSSRLDERGRPSRIYFSRLRALLTSAGFEVVDCPALTARGKNAADIRIVLDVVDALDAAVPYDEFVIVSSDSDFTPLMHRLRAADRRVVAVAAETSSSAYLSVVDNVLTTGDLLGLINSTIVERATQSVAEASTAGSDRAGDATYGDLQRQFEEFLRNAYSDASAPLNLAALASEVRDAVGDVPPDYFGAGSFTAALARIGLEGATFGQLFVWDPARHTPPAEPKGDQLAGAPQAVRQVSAVTGLPRLSTADWEALHDVLATYARTQEWNLIESTKWTRDRLVDQGQPIGRLAIGFVVKALSRTTAPLSRIPAPTAGEIAGALSSSIIARAAEAGLVLSDDEASELGKWMSVPAVVSQVE
ncbi:NYN domain-containing protein [Pedococcus sp. P5_B7]